MEFLESNQIRIEVPTKPKKMTATRFATALGLNAWETPFSAWCQITRTYQEPFEDTMYTIAGKVIEPKIIDYLNQTYFLEIKDPTKVYGPNYFKETRGDFFSNHKVFGGMWDALGRDFVVEIKTTKRAEDWAEDIPIYYKLQAALYAYLLGVERVIVTASFLEERDYLFADAFEPTVENTMMREFMLSEEFPNFEEDYIQPALRWWENHVETGISPVFDEEKDADILRELRTNYTEITDDVFVQLLDQADELQHQLDEMKQVEEQLKQTKDKIKEFMTKQFRDGDRKVEIASKHSKWSLTKSVSNRVDTAALKKAGLYDHFIKQSESMTLKNTPLSA